MFLDLGTTESLQGQRPLDGPSHDLRSPHARPRSPCDRPALVHGSSLAPLSLRSRSSRRAPARASPLAPRSPLAHPSSLVFRPLAPGPGSSPLVPGSHCTSGATPLACSPPRPATRPSPHRPSPIGCPCPWPSNPAHHPHPASPIIRSVLPLVRD